MQNKNTPHTHPNDPALYGSPLYPQYGGAYDMQTVSGSIFDNPLRLLRILLKRWLMVLLCLLFAATAATFYLTKAPKVYRAESLIELSVRRPRFLAQQAAVIEDAGGSAGSTEEIFNTRIQRFRGRTTMTAALHRLLEKHPDAFLQADDKALSDEHQQQMQLSRFMNHIQLDLMRRTRIVKITFEHTDPALATAACNAFSEAAVAGAFQENRSSSDAAVVWLESQEKTQREALQKAEEALLTFTTESRIDAIESSRKTVEEALLSFNRSLVEIESEEARERDLLAALEALEISPEEAESLPSDIPRADEIRTVLNQWREVIVAREQLLARYTENHPDVKDKDRLIQLYREQAMEAINQARNTTRANQQLLARQADSLRQKKQEQSELAADLDAQIAAGRTQMASLTRARDTAEQAYRGILTRIQEARMAADEDTATVKIAEPATMPRAPVKPRPVIILALALLLGLGGGSALAIATELIEDHVSDPEDLHNWGLSLLAVVPRVQKQNRNNIATASLQDRFSQVTEAFAGLRAMLDSPQHKGNADVVLIASSIPGEGKTVTSCNLASAWARKGHKVLLLDFDLRRPQVAGIFPMPAGQKGLLQTLATNPDLNDGQQLVYPAADCPNLHIIATRPHSGASPAEMAGTTAVERLIAWGRANYDHIVIDAPPLGLVSDALALAPLADSILVMVRPAVSRRRITLHTIHRFQESGIENIALVLNDVDFKKLDKTGYGHYYHHYQNHEQGA